MSTGKTLYRRREEVKSLVRIVFGVVWLIDGLLKFQPGMPAVFVQLIQAAGQGQPGWLLPWFNFWANTVASNPGFWVMLIGTGELLLGLALVFGVVRKLAYVIGFFFSLVIWSVPEGFGGPYGPSSTDIGTGVIYAIVFLMLMLINAGYGTSKYSLDALIEKRIKWWGKIAEFSRIVGATARADQDCRFHGAYRKEGSLRGCAEIAGKPWAFVRSADKNNQKTVIALALCSWRRADAGDKCRQTHASGFAYCRITCSARSAPPRCRLYHRPMAGSRHKRGR